MKIRTVLLVSILLIVAVSSVSAFRLTPMVKEFAPAGAGARQTFTVINDENRPIAVRIEFAHREMDIHGEETLSDASDLFRAFPEQMVVQPNSQQVVRVQWRGSPSVGTEQPFRIIARQLPVEFDQQQQGVNINIMFVYQGSVYITPPQQQAGLEIASVERTAGDDGQTMLTFELNNTGNVHTIIERPEVTVQSASGGSTSQVTLGRDQLGRMNGLNVLAGNRRLVSIPWPDALPEGDLHATSFNFTRR